MNASCYMKVILSHNKNKNLRWIVPEGQRSRLPSDLYKQAHTSMHLPHIRAPKSTGKYTRTCVCTHMCTQTLTHKGMCHT